MLRGKFPNTGPGRDVAPDPRGQLQTPFWRRAAEIIPAMMVSFIKTGLRRYGLLVQRERAPELAINPAPGYHAHLPHDMLHFVAEAEWRLDGAVFGQLAAGGDAGIFIPTDKSLIPGAMRDRKDGSGVQPSRKAADPRYSPKFSKTLGTRVTAANRCRPTGRSNSRPRASQKNASSTSSTNSTDSPNAGIRFRSGSK